MPEVSAIIAASILLLWTPSHLIFSHPLSRLNRNVICLRSSIEWSCHHTRGVYFEFNSVTSHLLQSGVCFVSSIDVEPSFILSHEPPKVFTTSSVCFVAFIMSFYFHRRIPQQRMSSRSEVVIMLALSVLLPAIIYPLIWAAGIGCHSDCRGEWSDISISLWSTQYINDEPTA